MERVDLLPLLLAYVSCVSGALVMQTQLDNSNTGIEMM